MSILDTLGDVISLAVYFFLDVLDTFLSLFGI